ncbi:hypothetical protein TCDM_11727 [Trypanosoma cruzi Dm28c]|uniref:Uncharacterized protein n=1 Tax=Trypanosoma cruzi Dm28c TaxID=1416333 RepID=V5AZN7_TRYCR|nr:hypothetical protein TCDM_11727 [Trypanosoma cruzi Dm28c]
MHIYNGHVIVCASWGEVRARVHARGHTHRERRKSVCAGGACLSLTLTLTRLPPQPQQPQQQQEAKEGRWCGRPRCCCHCRQPLSPYHLFERRRLSLLFLVLYH